MDNLKIKIELFSLCKEYVEQKIEAAHEAIDNVQASANEETKSSSGDKYETGRSMMQLEIEKYSSQLNEGYKLNKVLSQIDYTKTYSKVVPGSLVITDKCNFFISISAGKLKIDENEYTAVSYSSPIGQALANKEVNDKVEFRDKIFRITEIT